MDFQKGIRKSRKTILDSLSPNAFLVIICFKLFIPYALFHFMLQFPGQEEIFLQRRLRIMKDKPLLDERDNFNTSKY